MTVNSIAAPVRAAQVIDVLMRCPRCGISMDGVACPSCGFWLRIRDGIIDALLPERAAYYERFVEEYERVRAAEGRGSLSEEFYLAIPLRDISERNTWQWRIRAKSFNYLVGHLLTELNIDKQSRILDIGAGNCWMSYRLASEGFRPYAVDLLTNDLDGLGCAKHYCRRLPNLFPRCRAEMSRLPFGSGQFDAAIFNASFHYSESYEAALSEALRCVKKAGSVVICDTAWYSNEESGQRMIVERREAFRLRYGTTSDSIQSLEYLTDSRLHALEQEFSIRWQRYSPWYGIRWAMRPVLAKMHGRREPSQFRIYVARKER